jgi:hypothetical protein
MAMNKALCFTVMRVVVVLLAGGLLHGCGGIAYKSISGSDNSAFFPSARFTHPLHEQPYPSVASGASGTSEIKPAPAAVDHSAALDLELVRTKGRASESLLSGEQVLLNGTLLTGPVSIEETFSLSMASLAYRNRFFVHPKIYLDLFEGLLQIERDLTLESGSGSVRSKLSQMGVLLGLGAGWKITNRATLDFRWLPLAATADSSIKVVDLTATYWFTDHAGVSGGYRRWHYEEEPQGSKIDLFWEGYSGGLVFSY